MVIDVCINEAVLHKAASKGPDGPDEKKQTGEKNETLFYFCDDPDDLVGNIGYVGCCKVTTKSANCAAKTANCRIVTHPYSSFPRPFSVVFDRLSAN